LEAEAAGVQMMQVHTPEEHRMEPKAVSVLCGVPVVLSQVQQQMYNRV